MPDSVRRTKIVATLGPAWAEPAQMTALLDAGVNVVRINASHGTAEIRAGWVGDLQRLMKDRAESAAILVDLQGPRIRVGTLEEPMRLAQGQRVVFAPEAEVRPGEIPTTYDALASDVHVGARILLDDGLLSVEVTGVRGARVEAVVHYGGDLKSHKGMNLPGLEVSAPALTEKDREDVEQAVALGADYIALSFVRRPEDMEGLRALVPRSTKLIAKIEKDTALRNLCGILDASDAIMVARGDLGVELPFEEVPLMQKQIIRESSLHGKPVITATQMLESMINAPRPTRAEASDVANGGGSLPAGGGARDGPHRPGDGAAAPRPRGHHRRRPGPPGERGRAAAAPPGRADRPGAHRGRDRGGGVRGGGDAERPGDPLLHQQRLHRPQGGHLPSRRAGLRLHAGARDLPSALPGVGGHLLAHRPSHGLRRDARRGPATDHRARPGPAG
jgi:hypothetical protein